MLIATRIFLQHWMKIYDCRVVIFFRRSWLKSGGTIEEGTLQRYVEWSSFHTDFAPPHQNISG